MEQDFNEKHWNNPCPKYDCRKAACKCGLKYVNIPASLGDDSEGSNVAPKNGAYCNALVIYEANNHVYIYSKEGVPTLIDVDASDIAVLEQEVRKAQKDIHEFREELDEFIHGFNTVSEMTNATTLSDGDYAETYGFYELNDGGGAKYKVRSKSSSDVVDGAYILQLNSINLVAELIIEGELHSKQLGLKGDGTTDETIKLNTFLDTPVFYKRVLDKGVYLCSSTVYIKGLWRQNSGDNGLKEIVFDSATIKYTGVEDKASIVVYNHFMSKITGLSLARDSVRSYVEIVGCWHLTCDTWDIKDLNITNSRDNLTGKTIATDNNEYISFEHVYVLGTLSIPTISGHYTNCINFTNSLIGTSSKEYCVVISGANSHQQLSFLFSDLSYASKAVFNIVDTQTGKGAITCYGCYFDSAKPIFENNNKNGIVFSNVFSLNIANANEEIVNIKYTDFMNCTNMLNYTNRGSNFGGGDCNLAVNGDLSSDTVSGHNSNWYGPSNSDWTKTYESSDLNINGRCRKLVYTGSSNSASFAFGAVNAPRDDYYTSFIRLRVVSGNYGSIQTSTASHYVTYTYDKIGHNEVVLCNSKENFINAGGDTRTTVYIYDIDTSEEDLVVEVYESGLIEGKIVKFNLPLHANAKIE